MSYMTYTETMNTLEKPLVWLHGEVKTPPFSKSARLEAGYLLRALQKGEMITLPHSRPMPNIGFRCHELRINDRGQIWRIIYRIDKDALVILDAFQKKSPQTPKRVIQTCQRRIKEYDSLARGG
jgi:phage-related protein